MVGLENKIVQYVDAASIVGPIVSTNGKSSLNCNSE